MTTIAAVRRNGHTAIAGDGKVTGGEKVIMKGTAEKIRPIYGGKVVVGFAGGVADAVTLQDWFEKKLELFQGNLQRSAVALAQKLEAMLIAMDGKELLLISGNGEVIAPDEDVLAIGSGGNFAQAAAVALLRHTEMDAGAIAKEAVGIASSIDIFTNSNIKVSEL